jgi:hypothetical protein
MVRWIFAQRLVGHSVARIARALNEAEVSCPSAADPGRNLHRSGTGWTLGTVTTILSNPRYTGHQVWNRQRTDKDLADPADVSPGHKQVQRWNLPDGWVILQKTLARGIGQRGRLHRRPGHQRRPRPRAARRRETAGKTAVPAGRDHRLRHVRQKDGISVVPRQARLPVPPRPHHRLRAQL